MNTHEIDHTLKEVERAITLLNGPGFQTEVHSDIPPFGEGEAQARLTAVLEDDVSTNAQRALAERLQERLREKFRR